MTKSTKPRSLPNRPLSPATVRDLEASDRISSTLPLASRENVDVDEVYWILLQTSASGFLLEYVPWTGWIVKEKVTGEASSPEEVYRDLVECAIEWQQERDGLWVALLDGGRRDLRDL